MRSRPDDIRKRIARRKREKEKGTNPTKPTQTRLLWTQDEEKYGFEKISSYEGGPDEGVHPLFRKELFLFKVLASACLFLLVAIMFRNDGEALNPIKSFVQSTMEKDFQFAAVSSWYEDQFGKPLALLPFSKDKEVGNESTPGQQYALPASGRILEEFGSNGQRITIETNKDAAVEAMNEGFVLYTGDKEGFGKTVVIQHADKSETWYGNLDSIEVSLYQFIEKGTSVGIASDGADETKGAFYFAIKKGDDFIDPIKVIQFD